MWDDTLLHIARLTDPSNTGSKNNLTVQQLPCIVEENLKVKIQSLIEDTNNKSSFCRDLRNRKLAHSDLELAVNERATPLERGSRKKVKDALASISIVLNTVANNYLNTTILFDGLSNPQGVNSLLYVLDDGLRAEEERQKRIKTGEYDTGDFAQRDL